jgi:hypothetical protein
MQNWTNQRRGLTEVQLPFLHMCVALQKFTSRAHLKFFLRPRGALHMYMALRLFNLHLWCALLQFNFFSVFTSCEQTLKIHIVPMKAQKNLKPPCVY